MIKTLLILFTLITFITNLNAQELNKNIDIEEKPFYNYKTPENFDFLTNIPDDFVQLYDISTDPDNLWTWGAIVSSTVLLWYYDDELIKWAEDTGDNLGIQGGDEETSQVLLSAGPYPILKVPSDLGSTLYFIGDGTVHLGIMAGFLGYGYFGDDVKALNVGSQLAEGLFDVAIITQTLKHITGREAPFKMTAPRGRWDLFPNQIEYAKDVPKYDAFPSGHLATTMMTTTVLHENYPDNIYILPVGYTLMGLLSFQMLNNGVHWASDYPLAIGIGYTIGKIVSKREINKAKDRGRKLTVIPKIYQDGYGIALNYSF